MKEEVKYKQPTSPFWEKVKADYPNQWVLIGNPVIPRGEYAIYDGEVLFASDKRDEISVASRKYADVYCAIDYTGQRPKRLFLL